MPKVHTDTQTQVTATPKEKTKTPEELKKELSTVKGELTKVKKTNVELEDKIKAAETAKAKAEDAQKSAEVKAKEAEKASKELQDKLAAAEKASKELQDKLAAAEAKIKDLEAQPPEPATQPVQAKVSVPTTQVEPKPNATVGLETLLALQGTEKKREDILANAVAAKKLVEEIREAKANAAAFIQFVDGL